MCDKTFKYDGFQLWSYYDKQVSSNTLAFEFYTYVPDNATKFVAPRFKLSVYNKDKYVNATFSISELYKYHYMLKKKILDPVSEHQNKIKQDQKYTDGFSLPAGKTNNIYTTIMYHYLMDSACVRFMVGEKEKTIFDTDKVYVPLLDVTSLYKIVGQAIDNYCLMSQNISIMNMITKNHDECIDKYNNVIDQIGKVGFVGSPILKSPIVEEKREFDIQIDNIIKEPESESVNEDNVLDILVNGTEESEDLKIDENSEQAEFDSFLDENVDKYKLDLPDKSKTEVEIKMENVFQNKVLNNDFTNLEKIITNCVNSPVPLQAFVDTVFSTCGVDLYDGVSDVDKYAINYVASLNVKHSVQNYIQKKISFPKSINPIIIDSNCKDKQNKIDTMYFLLMSYIYTNKIKTVCCEKNNNDIENKTFMSYCLKTITSPFVFTYMTDINRDTLENGVSRLYFDLKGHNFFNKYESEIYDKFRTSIQIDEEYLKTETGRIYDSVIKLKEKLKVANFFKPKFMKLTYEDFVNGNEPYNKEILNKICLIEHGFIMNKVESVLKTKVTSTDDIPANILLKYGLSTKKYDNGVLVQYIQTKYPKFADLEQIKKINENVSDIIAEIDITKYPLDVLKSLYFWGSVDKRTITYNDFVKQINNSSLTESELMSLILKDGYKQDDDFFNSLSLIK